MAKKKHPEGKAHGKSPRRSAAVPQDKKAAKRSVKPPAAENPKQPKEAAEGEGQKKDCPSCKRLRRRDRIIQERMTRRKRS